MLQVARLAPRLLADATPKVTAFYDEQFNDDGGGCDRAGRSDLYYTVFAAEGMLALQSELPADAMRGYLEKFGPGDDLDLVHLGCLARCWACLGPDAASASVADGILLNLERFRAADGGFDAKVGSDEGTVYHAFIALGACQDVGREMTRLDEVVASVEGLRTGDGGYANTKSLPVGSTTVTAAAVTILRYLGRDVPQNIGSWILQRIHADGGFLAAPRAPMPDLLSTATALHALSGLQIDYTPVRERCLDFIDTLWTGQGFCGHWADDVLDAEYTFYALLSLGHLS
ncbi:MAG: hypothetical protein CMJ83_16960 [Planctomycetes bacterium]|nr:hypothetical protein [Planctomycetota bacterium]